MSQFSPLTLKPGVEVEKTPLYAESLWSTTGLVRFFNGLLQKLGGWLRLTGTALAGTCRGIIAWQDTTGTQYIGAGTEQRLYVVSGGTAYDITPLQHTSNLATPFTTTIGSNSVKVTDAGFTPAVGDWVNVLTQASVGGIVLYGPYPVATSLSSTEYTILAEDLAAASGGGGLTAKFYTTNTSSTVKVELVNHGLVATTVFTVPVSLTVGGLTIFGDYLVDSVIDDDNFNIIVVGAASSTTSAFENTGNVRIEYLISSGAATAVPYNAYSIGVYGAGAYGFGSGGTTVIRQWSLSAWGSFLISSPTNGPVYVWTPASGFVANPSTLITQAPAYNTQVMLVMPQQQLVALGAQDPITTYQDPLLIRWCDVGDYTVWTPSSLNQAGSFRLPRGSKIVGGIQANNQVLIFTDLGVWAMQYIGYPLVYGFNEIGVGCGLLSMRSVQVVGDKVYWASQKGMFVYAGGSITPIPCPVWDKFFGDLNVAQADKITSSPNSSFSEAGWYYPSESATENDSHISVCTIDGSWTYDQGSDATSYVRTAWFDQSVVGPPIGVDLSGIIQQHEVSVDADGSAMTSTARTGWFKLQSGSTYISLERIIPDFILEGTNASVSFTVYVADYPEDTPRTYGPYTVTSSTKYVIIRARGRIASIEINCSTLGTFWRLGQPLIKTLMSGRR